MKGPIDEISIRAVRGVRGEVALRLDGRSLVLRGDNGTGKSSIVHGLGWALMGRGAPTKTGTPSEQSSYWRHVLEAAPDAPKVVVKLAPQGSIEVTTAGDACDATGEAFRGACARATPFLRRPDLLHFLDAKPGERFKYLETFLDLDAADEVRDALAANAKEFAEGAKSKKQEYDVLLSKAAALLPIGRRNASDWTSLEKTFTAWAAELGLDVQGTPNWDDLETVCARAAATVRGEELGKRRAALTRTLARLNAIAAPADATGLLAELRAVEERTAEREVINLLGEAIRVVTADLDAKTCPVCEQTVDRNHLLGELERRRADLEQLSTVRRRIEESATGWRAFLIEVDGATAEAEACATFEHGQSAVPGALTPNASAGAVLDIVTRDGRAVARDAERRVRTARDAVAEQLASLPAEDRAEAIRAFVSAFEHASNHRLAIAIAAAERDRLTKFANTVKTVGDAFRRARQDVAQELLNEIGALVARFYERVHPPTEGDEVTGAPSIEVQGHGGGTAYVRGKFKAAPIEDPRWVYSDGHLDTVGICVFLALRRFRADRDKKADPKLMVLDDIVLSIDLRHGRRFLEVLREEFDDHQVIILTHNGLFADWCKKHLPSYQQQVIARWSLEAGPHLGQHQNALEHLEQSIDEVSSPKLLAQAVMNVLDEWLADARYAYSLAVPARRGDEYTLTDLWNPFRKTFRDVTKKLPIANLGQVLERLPDVEVLRNRLGAHENDSAKEFPLEGVREIARDAATIVRTLYCVECGGFAEAIPRIEAPEMLRCKCERLRYIRPAKQDAARGGNEKA